MSRRARWPVVPLLSLIVLGAAGTSLRAQPALAGPSIAISPPASDFSDLAMAARPEGGFIAVWQANLQVWARGYDARGRPSFAAIPLGQANGIDVAAAGSGFVVAGLQRRETDPIRLARIYDAAGRPQGSLIRIETAASSPRAAPPRVAADERGGFVVAWVGSRGALAPAEVFVRRFDPRGAPQGAPVRVVRPSSAGVCCVDVARAPGGEVLVVWLEQEPWLVWGQLYRSGGEALGSPFPISSGRSFREPVAVATRDGFLVSWHAEPSAEQPLASLQGRIYSRAGQPRGEPFVIAQMEEAFSGPVLAADADGRSWVAWLSTRNGIHVREIAADGSLGPVPSEERPGLWRAAQPLAAAGWGDGQLAVGWQRRTPDLDASAGLVAQRMASGGAPGVLQLAARQIVTAEGDGPVTLAIERREGTLGDVSVDYAVSVRNAGEGDGVLAVSGTATFADGDSSPRSVTVPVLDDALPEADERLVVELSFPTGGARLGPVSQSGIEIRDDDVPSPLLAGAGTIATLDVSIPLIHGARLPAVAALAGGGFVALWQSTRRLYPADLLNQRLFDSAGREISRSFASFVDTYRVRVVAQPGGGFTVVNAGDGIFGQRFDAQGRPLTDQFALPGMPAALAAGRSGGLLTLWGGDAVSLVPYGPRGQQSGPRQIVDRSPACGGTLALASGSSGQAAAVWRSASCDQILVRRTDALGHPLGQAVGVLPRRSPDVGRVAVAAAPDGRFVVVWEGSGGGGGGGIFARRFGADGRPLGPVIQVDSHWNKDARDPQVAMQGDGRFLVLWQSLGEPPDRKLFGQYFAADGRRLGSDFALDSEVPDAQEVEPSLATDAAGRYVAAWRRTAAESINERRLAAPPE